jgi:hypothetical protein
MVVECHNQRRSWGRTLLGSLVWWHGFALGGGVDQATKPRCLFLAVSKGATPPLSGISRRHLKQRSAEYRDHHTRTLRLLIVIVTRHLLLPLRPALPFKSSAIHFSLIFAVAPYQSSKWTRSCTSVPFDC